MFLMIIRITKDRGISTDRCSNTYGNVREKKERRIGEYSYVIIEVGEKEKKD